MLTVQDNNCRCRQLPRGLGHLHTMRVNRFESSRYRKGIAPRIGTSNCHHVTSKGRSMRGPGRTNSRHVCLISKTQRCRAIKWRIKDHGVFEPILRTGRKCEQQHLRTDHRSRQTKSIVIHVTITHLSGSSGWLARYSLCCLIASSDHQVPGFALAIPASLMSQVRNARIPTSSARSLRHRIQNEKGSLSDMGNG